MAVVQQLTLAILKPHVVKHPIVARKIREIIVANGFQIVQSRIVHLTKGVGENFYGEHAGKFFYERLIAFMTSGPCDVLILAKPDAIRKWRELMGPTKVFAAVYSHPASIRSLFGLSDTRNACHGSDSPEAVVREIAIFFPQFDARAWREAGRKNATF